MCVVAQPENVMYAVFYSKHKVPQGEMLCVFFISAFVCWMLSLARFRVVFLF